MLYKTFKYNYDKMLNRLCKSKKFPEELNSVDYGLYHELTPVLMYDLFRGNNCSPILSNLIVTADINDIESFELPIAFLKKVDRNFYDNVIDSEIIRIPLLRARKLNRNKRQKILDRLLDIIPKDVNYNKRANIIKLYASFIFGEPLVDFKDFFKTLEVYIPLVPQPYDSNLGKPFLSQTLTFTHDFLEFVVDQQGIDNFVKIMKYYFYDHVEDIKNDYYSQSSRHTVEHLNYFTMLCLYQIVLVNRSESKLNIKGIVKIFLKTIKKYDELITNKKNHKHEVVSAVFNMAYILLNLVMNTNYAYTNEIINQLKNTLYNDDFVVKKVKLTLKNLKGGPLSFYTYRARSSSKSIVLSLHYTSLIQNFPIFMFTSLIHLHDTKFMSIFKTRSTSNQFNKNIAQFFFLPYYHKYKAKDVENIILSLPDDTYKRVKKLPKKIRHYFMYNFIVLAFMLMAKYKYSEKVLDAFMLKLARLNYNELLSSEHIKFLVEDTRCLPETDIEIEPNINSYVSLDVRNLTNYIKLYELVFTLVRVRALNSPKDLIDSVTRLFLRFTTKYKDLYPYVNKKSYYIDTIMYLFSENFNSSVIDNDKQVLNLVKDYDLIHDFFSHVFTVTSNKSNSFFLGMIPLFNEKKFYPFLSDAIITEFERLLLYMISDLVHTPESTETLVAKVKETLKASLQFTKTTKMEVFLENENFIEKLQDRELIFKHKDEFHEVFVMSNKIRDMLVMGKFSLNEEDVP